VHGEWWCGKWGTSAIHHVICHPVAGEQVGCSAWQSTASTQKVLRREQLLAAGVRILTVDERSRLSLRCSVPPLPPPEPWPPATQPTPTRGGAPLFTLPHRPSSLPLPPPLPCPARPQLVAVPPTPCAASAGWP